VNPELLSRKVNVAIVSAAPSAGINDDLIATAKPGALVMHCLPAYRGKEITDAALEAHADTIFQQAENRLHTQKAILSLLTR